MISVAGFFGWWVEELSRIVEPLALRRGAAPDYLIVQKDAGFRCMRAGRKGLTDIGDVGPDAPDRAGLLKKLKNQQVELRLDPDLVLDKHLTLPAAGQQYVEAILRHQIERLTPWAADHVVFDYVLVDDGSEKEGQTGIRLVATARDTIQRAVDAFDEAGIGFERIGTATDPIDTASPVDLQESARKLRETALRRKVGLALAAAAVVLLALGGFQSWRLYTASQDLAGIQQAVDSRRALIAEAVARTTASDEFRALSARKESALPMVVLLENLSETIPDNTYLSELNVEGAKVRINGNSEAATALIALLEQSEVLDGAQFVAPTTRTEDGKVDSFQIVARIVNAAEPEP